ncbi:hypothetical protein SLEP1_g9494 [Rubroshorea leprosula]|uniref:SAM domain-containing protein n=2 Tax=Rubroshorea leprosula TaxID=152421 RepID=A0AAV5IEB8_9ROSI|nr:hypothetical protein SLEP1_g9494 [Rubroshorea leprosula]
MAAELQPQDPPLVSPSATEPAAAPPVSPPIAAAAATAATATTTTVYQSQQEHPGPPLTSKRQRRPSVRLGEIGDQSSDSHARRTKHPQPPGRFSRDTSSSKSVKARSLVNLVNGDAIQENEDNNQNGNNKEFVHRKAKARRGTMKRVRSNWIPRHDDGAENSREEGEEGFRDFDPDSDSPLRDQSPLHSTDNVAAIDTWHRRPGSRPGRARVSDNNAMEMDNLPESDNDRRCGRSEGVRTWLIELGLSRYAPVFEIHEVDDEILPLLTLEDLKDMGINAVGSRRKLYSAIQKLRKGFSLRLVDKATLSVSLQRRGNIHHSISVKLAE